jgi:cell wall-associated NlpC family hydrolase
MLRSGTGVIRMLLIPLVMGAWGCVETTAFERPQPFPGAPAAPAPASGRADALAAAIVRDALALRGAHYRLGGTDPARGFDCSGLVRYVYEEHHVEVPRTVAEQYSFGETVPTDEIRAGDLVFFDTSGGGPSHVGIAIDDEHFVHAPGTGRVVRVEPMRSPYWGARLIGARRVPPA